ncbi:hypothetical protein IWX81_001141 [Salinibacterium sp. CAN_S4]|uniref:hypothetical protein n=1 Tax=Salinibacterium sp. CAN_S4 TaxID=2787727 RepID=UPI0018EFC749
MVVGVTDAACMTWSNDGPVSVPFAAPFPSSRTDRVSPGHLVAVATAPDGRSAVVWRWFDVVILGGGDPDSVRLWEPGHGAVTARQNDHHQLRTPGSRAYAFAGLQGDEWLVAGQVVDDPSEAEAELDKVRALYDENEMWSSVFSGTV